MARLLSLSRSAVYGLIAAGQLPHIRLGSLLRVPRAALERWIQDQTIEPRLTPARPSLPPTPPPPAALIHRRSPPPSRQPCDPAGRAGLRIEKRPVPIRSEPRPWRVLVDERIGARLRADAATITALRRLDDAQVAHFGVGPVRATPAHDRGVCWNARTAYDESTGLFGGPGALHFDTWHPDMVAVSDPDLASALRADNPWFLIVDGAGLLLEIADWRAEYLKEGTSPFPDRVAKRQAMRRRERRRARRADQGTG